MSWIVSLQKTPIWSCFPLIRIPFYLSRTILHILTLINFQSQKLVEWYLWSMHLRESMQSKSSRIRGLYFIFIERPLISTRGIKCWIGGVAQMLSSIGIPGNGQCNQCPGRDGWDLYCALKEVLTGSVKSILPWTCVSRQWEVGQLTWLWV
jgi:hypothetical protein